MKYNHSMTFTDLPRNAVLRVQVNSMKLSLSILLNLLVVPIANAQWVQNGSSYSFNSSSATNTQSGSNLLNIYNTSSGVSSISATISSSNGTTAAGTWSGSNSSMFSIFGYGGALGSQSPFPNGPNLSLSSSASAAYSLSGSSYVGGFPANGLTGAPPIYSSGSGSLINVISNGVSLNNYFTSTPPGYSGGNGGNVGVSIAPLAGGATLLQLGGPSSGAISGSNSGIPWEPSASVINAASYGGNAIAQWTQGTSTSKGIWGNGGNGGSVNVDTSSGTTLSIGSSQNPVNGQVAGISAISQGAAGAACCYTVAHQPGTPLPVVGQIVPNLTVGYGGAVSYNGMGLNGNGGTVSINNNATISAAQNILSTGQYGGNLYGIVAASIGGAAIINPHTQFANPAPPASPVGLGGSVSVTNNATINLPGQNSIGIMAVSASNQTIVPSQVTVTGSGSTAAPVSVVLNQNSSITTGNNNTGTSTVGLGNISGGVFAISSTGWLVSPFSQAANSSISAGNGGPVTVNNAGSINSYGHVGLGIAALSIGNTGFMSNYLMSTNPLANNVTYVGSGVSSNGFNSSAGSSTVTNSGTISTLGSSAAGILAASNGNGGFLGNDTNPVTYGPVTQRSDGIQIASGYSAGSVLGGNSGNYVASGGTVSVTNSGQIYTGSPNSTSGVGSVGIVAQSVGGGGGTVGGRAAAIQVGDSDGNGGAGGPITVNNSGGLVVTYNDGSHGILAQSVGGGGGNAANASGLFVAVGGAGGGGGNGGSVSITTGGGPGGVSTSGDFSTGIVGQSIGGGGGNGGFSKSYGVFVSTAIGGSGGSGGAGGTVAFNNQGYTNGNQINQITTSGDQSLGVLLQSIGGGGGVGGAASSYAAGIAFASAIAVGGTGGTGGSGGTIGTSATPVLNSGNISTAGLDSIGVLIQSVGGGGGHAGSAFAKSIAASPDKEIPAIAFSSSIGGKGGGTGNGGGIYFQNNGSISTIGTNSHAIVMQSIGGGGGAGGDASVGASTVGIPEVSIELSVGVGGSSSAGGNGGVISFTSGASSSLNTFGHNASGILLQSIGGGGGVGGVGNSTQPGGAGGELTLTPSISVGGQGGGGGAGGAVTLTNAGAINTYGTTSSAILAQSIGGGGGAAGSASVYGTSGSISANIAVGGNGGAGGSAGAVTITNSGTISTGASIPFPGYNNVAIGGDSHGLAAQSISGGGGIGGSADPTANLVTNPYIAAADRSLDAILTWKNAKNYFFANSAIPPFSYTAKIGVGGQGGAGGVAGVVSVTNTGVINTIGHRSFGILAQSIGGGGGTGASVMSGSSAVGSSLSGGIGLGVLTGLTFETGVNVGGSGGTSSTGNTVNVTQTPGTIVTAGYGSHGVVAQSIGGGGGVGADGSIAANTGFTGSASVNGGVSGGFIISLGTTTLTPAIGAGGAVNYSGFGTVINGNIVEPIITTYGDHSAGVLAQSIGGGGGIGSGGCTNNGMSANASACFTNTAMTPGTTTPISFVNNGQAMALAINPMPGSTSASSSGGAVNITSYDTINVFGAGSMGIAAQSIGGGGGMILANSGNIASASLPAMATALGTGGSSTVLAYNINLASSATGSIGVLAQSIGGGGGFIGDPNMLLSKPLPSYTVSPIARSSNVNDGGSVGVTVNYGGSITLNGANQIGVFAQSVGGGGGIASVNGNVVTQNTSSPQGTKGGAGGSIVIDVDGSIIDVGNKGGTVGVYAQSQGNSAQSGSTNIQVILPQTLSSPTNYSGMIKADTGVVISGGSNSSSNPNLVYLANGSVIQAPNANYAIIADYGYTIVQNYGTISGGVNLGSTPGEFLNHGTFNSGQTVVVANNSLHNYGTLSIGGPASISRTQMQGRLVQYDAGKLIVTVDSASKAAKNDYLAINGNALVAGKVVPRAKSLLPESFEFLTANSLVSTASVLDAHVFDWNLTAAGNRLTMSPTANFSPTGYDLTPNQRSLANYLSRGWMNSDRALSQVFGYLHEIPLGAHLNYQNILNQLSGQVLNSQAVQMKTAFANSLAYSMSCPLLHTQSGDMKQTDCSWGFVSGNLTDQSSNASNAGYQSIAGAVRFGAQKAFDREWTTGFAVGYGTNKLTSSGFSSTGNMVDVSVSASKAISQWSFGTSLAYAQGWFNNSRTPQLFGLGAAERLASSYGSNSGLYGLGWRVRSAYELPLNTYYIKPYVDLDLIYTKQPGYSETSGILGLKAGSSDQINFVATPMVEIGSNWLLAGNISLRGYLSAGASFLPNNKIATQMTFMNAMGSNGSFNIVTNGPNAFGIAKAGLQAFETDKFEIRAEYGVQAGQGYLSQSLGANLIYRF